jgi:hypothetical protein
MKDKILAYACNHSFFEYTKASLASFSEHHLLHEWRILFADVGLDPSQRAELSRFGTVVDYPASTVAHFGIVWPSARARLKMLLDVVDDESVLLYLDSDTLIFDNLDNLVREFVESEKPVGIFIEDIDEWVRLPASFLWRDNKIPEEFVNQDKWRNEPFANAGVLLAQGGGARELGTTALTLYETYCDRASFSEQSVIVSLLYDRNIHYMRLASRYNCLAYEKHIEHVGAGQHYVGTRPYFRGERVAIRHFAGAYYKGSLDEALPLLDVDAKLLHLERR